MLTDLSVMFRAFRGWLFARQWQVDVTVGACAVARAYPLEGGQYLLEVDCQDERAYVYERRAACPQRFKSLDSVKQCARHLGVMQVELALDTPYDQMIGVESMVTNKGEDFRG